MTRPRSLFGAMAVFALFLATAATAQTTGTNTPSGSYPPASVSAGATSSRLARADIAFLDQAAQNGHAEVESSKLALTRATNAQVKSFAQQMIDDHTKANQELAALASSKGVQVPTEPSLAQRGKMKLLSAAEGASFDQRYADSMGVTAHQDTIKLFEKASTDAKDPDVKAFAVKMLPTLQHHLQMAQDLKKATGNEGKAQTSGTGTGQYKYK